MGRRFIVSAIPVALLALLVASALWPACDSRLPRASAAEVLRRARTGDLVYFRNFRTSGLYLWPVPLTHVGVVVVHADGTPHVVEMHQVGDAPRGYDAAADGPHTYPLASRLRDAERADARWMLYWCPLTGPAPAAAADADAGAAFFPDPPYVAYNYAYWQDEIACHLRSLWPVRRRRRQQEMERMHCGNYAVYVLRRLGVLPAETPLDCVLPSSIMAMSGRHGVLHRIDK